MQNIAPNEGRELKYLAILFARGIGLAALTGVLWGMREVNWIFWITAVLGFFPAIFAISVTAIAAAVARNIVCRMLNIVTQPRLGFCIGAMLFVGFLAILVAVFVFVEGMTVRL